MCTLGKQEWDEMTVCTTMQSFFERPNERSDNAHRFCSFKGRTFCLIELVKTPLRILLLEALMVLSIAVSVFETAYYFLDALFRFNCRRWAEVPNSIIRLLEFTGTALILPLKIVELMPRYLIGAVIHPGVAIRPILA